MPEGPSVQAVWRPHRDSVQQRREPLPTGRRVGAATFRESECGVPTGIRTRVLALKGPRPRPLDDGDARREPLKIARRPHRFQALSSACARIHPPSAALALSWPLSSQHALRCTNSDARAAGLTDHAFLRRRLIANRLSPIVGPIECPVLERWSTAVHTSVLVPTIKACRSERKEA